MRRALKCIFILLLGFSAMGSRRSFAVETKQEDFTLKSSAFENGGMIPENFTCEGKNISPPLEWRGEPSGTQSLVLIVEDPDAPMGNWVHWVIYNLPSVIHDVPEGLPAVKGLANGERQGTNSFQKLGYGGPCPPSGTHRYFFHFYALDAAPKLEAGLRKNELLKAIEGHILAQTELMGRYKRRSS